MLSNSHTKRNALGIESSQRTEFEYVGSQNKQRKTRQKSQKLRRDPGTKASESTRLPLGRGSSMLSKTGYVLARICDPLQTWHRWQGNWCIVELCCMSQAISIALATSLSQRGGASVLSDLRSLDLGREYTDRITNHSRICYCSCTSQIC